MTFAPENPHPNPKPNSSAIISEVLTHWEITDRDNPSLKRYYLLHWSSEFFLHADYWGVITHQGLEYHIIYHNCLREHLTAVKDVALSFRKLGFMPYGYVLVKPIYKD